MDTKDPQISRLLDSLNSRNERKKEAASQFPATKEEYMALEPTQRMLVAAALTQRYADVSRTAGYRIDPLSSKFATAKLDAGKGRFIEARVGYAELRPKLGRPASREIAVDARAIGESAGESGDIDIIGMVMLQRDTWRGDIEPPFVVSGDSPDGLALDDERAGLVIEMVDAAVCNLIDGVVAMHQNLGGRALTEAVQS